MTKRRHSGKRRSDDSDPPGRWLLPGWLGIPSLLKRVCVLAVLGCVASPVLSDGRAADYRSPSPLRDQKGIQVPLNKSRIVDLTFPVTRVSVANPAIADILVVNPEQIYIVGKQLGTTNMTLWDKDDSVKKMLGLEVTHDLEVLKEKMFRFLPTEKIRIESAQGAIVLSGEVSSTQKMDAALRLAQSFSTGDSSPGLPGTQQPNVLNLLQVGGSQQVMLEVKVAEISRTFLKRMDVRFTGLFNDGSLRMGLVSRGVTVDSDNGIRVDQIFTDRAAFANYLSGNFFFNVLIDAAREQGLARILAEPNLTALSGQEAKFLAGGEFPIPVAQDESVGVQFKEFGIGLVFVPLVLDSGLVSLKVNVSVSELSNEGSTVIQVPGSNSFFPVPSLITRAANSSVEVPSGQTIAIAGLINERLREGASKFPGLGDVPVLGTLFRSQDYQKNQTELVIFVTPRLARPTQPELVRLPTDDFVEPDDVEFYLLGRLQGRKPGEATGSSRQGTLGPDQTGSEGLFGHDL